MPTNWLTCWWPSRPMPSKRPVPADNVTADPANTGSEPAAAGVAALVDAPESWRPPVPHGTSLAILATLASIFALSWAQHFVVPLLVGIVISYTLNPLVGWLEAIRIPRTLGTLVVLAAVMGAIGSSAYSLRNEAQAIMTGHMGEDGVFYAEELLLKCPTRYEEAVPEQAG